MRHVHPSPSPEVSHAAPGAGVWKRLVAAPAIRKFQRSFTVATGLPLILVPVVGANHSPAANGGSLPYFNRAFRRYAGTSPSEYRAGLTANEGKRSAIQA